MKKGTRDAFNLLFNCRSILTHPRYTKADNWVIAMELFSVGSTSAREICREAGIDPFGKTVTKENTHE